LNEFLQKIGRLVAVGEVRISDHGYSELWADNLTAREVLLGVQNAVVVEDYPEFPKGPCILVLQLDQAGQPIHVVWGIPKRADTPAVLVTAYRPDPDLWESDWLRRRI